MPRRTLSDLPRLPKTVTVGFYPDEFLQYLRNRRGLALDIVADGEVVFDNGLYQKILDTYEEVTKAYGIVRLKQGWKISKSPLEVI